MKKLILLIVTIFCFVKCEVNTPLQYDDSYWTEKVYTAENAAGNYTCKCGWTGLAKLATKNETDYVCPKCGKQYQIITVGEMIIIIPEQEPIP